MAAAGNRPSRRHPRPAVRRAVSRLALAGSLTALPLSGHALGLGALRVHSSLGEPLEATAPVRLSAGESVEALQADLASESDYRMVGQERPPQLQRLRVKLLQDPEPHIRLSTPDPVSEPLMDVMVRLGGGGYQVLKQYTVALDPQAAANASQDTSRRGSRGRRTASGSSRSTGPASGDSSAEAGREAAAASEPPVLSAQKRPKVTVTSGWAKRNRYGPVRGDETLTTIVRRVRREDSVPLPAAMEAVWRHNRDAFQEGNMNGLREGAVLEMPSNRAVRRYSAEEAEDTIAEQREEWLASGHSLGDTRPGHQRYQVQVALDEEGGGGDAAGEGENAGSGGTPQADGDSAETDGESAKGAGEKAVPGTDLEQIQQRLAEQLDAQRQETGQDMAQLQERIGALAERLESQHKLIESQSRALEQVAERRAADREEGGWLLWLLAALNGVLLAALGWVAWRLRGLGARAAAGAEEEGSPAGTGEDPVARASELVAQGQDTAARRLLWQALERQPENWAVYGSLLDLYERAGDGKGFEEVAGRLLATLGDRESDWQAEVRSRGRALRPESPLFAEEPVAGEPAPAGPSEGEGAGGGSVTAPEEGPPSEEAEMPESAPQAEGWAEEGLVLPGGEESQVGSPAEEAPPEGAGGASEEENTLTWDLDWEPESPVDSALEPGTEEGSANPEPQADMEAPELELSEGFAPAAEGAGIAEENSGDETPEAPDFELDSDFAPGESAAAGTEAAESLPEAPDWELGELEEGAGETESATESGGEGAQPEPPSATAGPETDAVPETELPEPGGVEEGEAPGPGPEDSGTDLTGYEIDQGNELDLKLDLAEAFVDMDDAESARSLLEEVQSRGTEEQQDKAQRLLQRLSG